MRIPFTGWYLKIGLLPSIDRYFGPRTEVVEYATYRCFGFYFFRVYLNDWSRDA